MGTLATERFRDLARRYDVIGDVRGPGLFIGVDFVENRQTKAAGLSGVPQSLGIRNRARTDLQFGGAAGNVYKFKPPLTTPQAEFDRMLEISEEIVAFIQREVDELRRIPAVTVPAAFCQ